jgi:hypothetical protein
MTVVGAFRRPPPGVRTGTRAGMMDAPRTPGAAMTETEPTFAPNPTITAQLAELKELEAGHPVPTLAEVMADWKWLHDGSAAGTFDPEYKYGGLAVAIYNRQVVGTDTDPLQLRIDKARELGIHLERLVITSFYPRDW